MTVSRVTAWMPTAPSVRVMARATAEAAARGADLRVLSPALPPPQWSSWRAAASELGVAATWQEATRGAGPGPVPRSLLDEARPGSLVVADAASLPRSLGASLARHTDVYVVADTPREVRSQMREPAVVVGVPEGRDCSHLLSVAAREADIRNRHIIVVDAQSAGRAPAGRHLWEHRWLDALSHETHTSSAPLAPRVVVTRRGVLDALRDHVEPEDVLVLGAHDGGDVQAEGIYDALIRTPPCDLLLTSTVGRVLVGAATSQPASVRAARAR